MTNQSLYERRKNAMGPAYEHFYEKPLHLVKGEGVWLWDVDGDKYLDCYNNVASVGHCHPHVVEALHRQASTLNTHTRYLHENVVSFAERLTSKLPDKLSVCMVTCTGTEANDLAIQMARIATGNNGCMINKYAYHGNSTLVRALSPSDRPEGEEAPDWLTEVEPPNVYRGPHVSGEANLGEKYAGYVADGISELKAQNNPLAAFMVDTIFDANGALIAPNDYLKRSLDLVHNAGGLMIADEVQAGYCRTGTNWWGFQNYDVVPDIVTMGKPMGDGHPLAAVITTPEIAAKFSEHHGYFNTFGGNPVSTAVGLAVLDVIENENLLANVADVGGYLEPKLRELATKYAFIGNIQGTGLFWGLDMVKSQETKEPLSQDQLRQMTSALAKRGVLLGSTGRYENVLKIRPPLIFSRANVDQLIHELDYVFSAFTP
jgi:4-aminobutyrate aminotransferase-like enzyme